MTWIGWCTHYFSAGYARTSCKEPDEPDVVPMQPAPARVALWMIGATRIRKSEVFFDIGLGLGHVCFPAIARAQQFGLRDVLFRHTDAREAEVTLRTVFFLYTPCRGRMLLDVLEHLRSCAAGRHIRLCAYGPCVPDVAGRPWVRSEIRMGRDETEAMVATIK
jgi:hypothetical protein